MAGWAGNGGGVQPDPAVARYLAWVCGALERTIPEQYDDDVVVEAVLRAAAPSLG